jgi:predicted ATPase
MKERLVIKNFGPIKSVDLELDKMTILIGEQATGKSTIAKILAVCRYFSYLVDVEFDNSRFKNQFVEGLETWGLKDLIKNNSIINYYCKDYEILVQNKNKKVVDTKSISDEEYFTPELSKESDNFKFLVEFLELSLSPLININDLEDKADDLTWKIPNGFYKNQVSKVMNNPFYIPTERGLQSIFSLGKSSIQNISDSLFNQFAKMDMFARNFHSETEIKPLDIKYKNVNGQGFIKNKNQSEFSSLYNGASGYQSTIPVVLAIKYYTEIRRKSKTFIIEEPELNLFPKAQKKLMEFFVENINNNGHSFLLPTHSPYFLSAINDLLMAYKKAQKNKSEVEKIIKKESWLNPNDLSVYQLKDGFAYDIFDKELNLIGENIIDEASDEMNEEFEELLDIK